MITVRAGALRAIAAHARESWPLECCGLLIGTAGAVDAIYRARNVLASPARYLVCPEDHFAAIRFGRAKGLEVVGAYHSHPEGRPRPSETDRHEAHGEGFTYVIAGTRRLRRAWSHQRPRAYRGARLQRGTRAARSRAQPRSIEIQRHWVAAWRLVGGNFVQVPLVRLP